MLSRAATRFEARKPDQPTAISIEADALHLPLRDASLDLVVTAFGFRNLANYEAGLREFRRVLKPGGRLGILDFAEPGGLMGMIAHSEWKGSTIFEGIARTATPSSLMRTPRTSKGPAPWRRC
jgi:ubiquinone/menaquinone biosynthesis C-methylase UbiE